MYRPLVFWIFISTSCSNVEPSTFLHSYTNEQFAWKKFLFRKKINRQFLLCRFKSKIYVQKMDIVPLIQIFQQFMIAIFSHRIKNYNGKRDKDSKLCQRTVENGLTEDCRTFAEIVSRDLTYYCTISQIGFRAYNSDCIPVYQILT